MNKKIIPLIVAVPIFSAVIGLALSMLFPVSTTENMGNAHRTALCIAPASYSVTDSQSGIEYLYVKKLVNDKSRVRLESGESITIKTSVYPDNALNRKLEYSSSDESIATVDENGAVTAKKAGQAKIKVKSDNGIETETTVGVYNECPTKTVLTVKNLIQGEDYPNGCECVTSVMALNYLGINITVDDFIDYKLDYDYFLRDEYDETLRIGKSPWVWYNGSPRDVSGTYCFAPVIERAIKRTVSTAYYNVNVMYGKPMMQLCSDYVAMGCPVIVWATEEMEKLYVSTSVRWIDEKTGEEYPLLRPVHCLLLVGYDNEYYYFNDPMKGETVKYPKDEAEEAYESLEMQAIAVYLKNK